MYVKSLSIIRKSLNPSQKYALQASETVTKALRIRFLPVLVKCHLVAYYNFNTKH